MQRGCMQRNSRKEGPDVWQFRWSDTSLDGKRLYHKKIIGTVEQYPNEDAARRSVVGLASELNTDGRSTNSAAMTVAQLCDHFEHAVRVAGAENFKTKYAPEFPVVTILEASPGRVMTAAQLDALGLVAAPEPEIAPPGFAARTQPNRNGNPRMTTRQWPSYAISLAGAPPGSEGNGPDRSLADFSWCMTAIDWGFSVEDTAAKLVEVSEKARERVHLRDESYALITAQNAAAAVERNAPKRGRG
jgi:hypothetical protein